jgi:ADP-heptose:LPS heptosyltransferase
MRLVTQRTLDRVAGAVLCRLLSLFPWAHRQVPPGFRPRRILVILLSEMGSLVLSKSMFDLLRGEYPGAAIHLLVFERNRDVLDILDLLPNSRVLTISDRSFRRFMTTTIRVLWRLRRMKVDTAIDCELFSRVSSLFSLLSGARVRAGFERHTQEGLYRGGFINRPVLYSPYLHFSIQLMALAESLTLQGMPLVKRTPRMPSPDFGALTLDPAEKKRFDERVEMDFPQLDKSELVLISPGGGLLPIRAWPIDHYRYLVRGLLHRGYRVGIIGTEEDGGMAKELLLSCGGERCLDLTGYTKNLKELYFLLQRSVLLIGNDGGPAHFASISSTPTIVLFGPETPALYSPLGKRVFTFQTPLACSPCLTAYNHRRSPCDGNNLCLKLISPEAVLLKAFEMMGVGSGGAQVLRC